MKKPTPTQRKILESAAGVAEHRPSGRSEHGGWSGAYVVCRRNGWTDNHGAITDAGREAMGLPPLSKTAVPDGWTLVPIKPTLEMVKNAATDHEGESWLPHSLWASMLAAVPDINELAGEASAYTSEVHRAAAQAVSRARLDKSHQTTPSELCVVPAVTGGPANPSPSSDVAGIELAARFVEKRLHDYVSAHGVTDPDTGTVEYPGDGEEYVYELEEIIEGIRALAVTEADHG